MQRVCLWVAILTAVSITPARSQAFADLKSALVDYSKADLAPRKTCEALAKFKSKDIAEIHATEIPAAAGAPAHCRVTGLLSPEIAFEVSLPAKWNGRFYMIGNGGFAGDALDDPGRVAQRNEALKLGFAFAQTNTGHDARKEPGATFVHEQSAEGDRLRLPRRAPDRHNHQRDHEGLLRQSRSPSAYWNSCSNGGRQGLIEAQRFPDDFDGIIANSPWVDQTGFTIGAMWNQKALSAAPVTPAKLAMVADKVMAKCDAIDGLKDGLIDDPRKCNFDPARDVPACSAGADGPDCLTAAQAEAIAKVYSGPISNGKPFFPGYMPGSEAVVPGLFGGGAGSGWLNVIVAAQPDAQARGLQPGGRHDAVSGAQTAEAGLRLQDVRLRSRHSSAGRLEQTGRREEPGPLEIPEARRQAAHDLRLGGPDPAAHDGRELLRAGGGEERSGHDASSSACSWCPAWGTAAAASVRTGTTPMTAMIDWVEKGKAPESIVASRVVDNQVVRTRPLCPYPQVARYSGQGSIDEAANFRCVAP